ISQSPWTLAIETTGSGLALAPSASLGFSCKVTIPSLAPNLKATLAVGGFSLTFGDGKLAAQASPWLAPFQLIPAPSGAALSVALNDGLPRLLFSAAGGALLEALAGEGFTIPPLDTFFGNTGASAQRSPGIGNSAGDGFDSAKINRVLQAFNHLAGFAASPGL